MLQNADENNIPFLASALTFDVLLAAVPFLLLLVIALSHVLQEVAGAGGPEAAHLFRAFLPPRGTGDPFGPIERLLGGVTRNRGTISLYAIPAFVWFSTRLFAGVRTSLNQIFDVAGRPPRRRHFVVSWLLAKARDVAMVLATLVLFLANAALTAGLTVLRTQGPERLPEFAFFVTSAGRVLGDLLSIAFSVTLFFVVYKYASMRRLSWRAALLAAALTAVGFEIAKRLYAVYLAHSTLLRAESGDATIGALVLFVLWAYYTSLVFLVGAAVAETWELRSLQRRQRAVLR